MRELCTKNDLHGMLGKEDVVVRPTEPLELSALLRIAEQCIGFYWINNTLSEEFLTAFCEQAQRLRSLNLSGSAHVTNAFVNRLAARSTCLQALDVSFCPLDDSAFTALQAPLAFLNLQGCSLLTDATLENLAKIPTLRHLLIAFNDRVTPKGLEAFPSGQLKTLKIHGCRNIESLVA